MKLLYGAIAVLFLFIAAATVVDGKEACDEDAFGECVDAAVVLPDVNNENSPRIFGTTFETLCDHLENLRGCVKDKNCRSYKDGKGGRYLDTLEYVCSEDHKGDYKSATQCKTGDIVMSNLTSCSLEVAGDCEKYKESHSCTKAVLKERCSDEQAEVYVTAMEKMNKDPCSPSDGGSTLHHLAPMWMVSCAVWMLLTRWLSFW